MTATEKRIRIAELMGYTLLGDIALGHGVAGRRHWFPPGKASSFDSHDLTALPPYYTSRDACAEFEAGLTTDEQIGYMMALRETLTATHYSRREFAMITATPAQRCDAFLRVKGETKL